jgi:hypothetical protein
LLKLLKERPAALAEGNQSPSGDNEKKKPHAFN